MFMVFAETLFSLPDTILIYNFYFFPYWLALSVVASFVTYLIRRKRGPQNIPKIFAISLLASIILVNILGFAFMKISSDIHIKQEIKKSKELEKCTYPGISDEEIDNCINSTK